MCGDDEADELLFRSLFEAIISRGHSDPSELRPRLPPDQLDLILVDYLNYWLPIGSHDDGCLNAAVKANLVECSVLLLVARQHDKRAFMTLFEALEKTVDDPELTCKLLGLILTHEYLISTRFSPPDPTILQTCKQMPNRSKSKWLVPQALSLYAFRQGQKSLHR
jgi:hypothetical protein